MAPTTPPMGEPKRETKNVVLEHAVDRVSAIVIELQDFATRVKEGASPAPENKAEVAPVPSLETTLDKVPDRLNDIRDRIRGALESLTNSLL